jgi:hypothetical protein
LTESLGFYESDRPSLTEQTLDKQLTSLAKAGFSRQKKSNIAINNTSEI